MRAGPKAATGQRLLLGAARSRGFVRQTLCKRATTAWRRRSRGAEAAGDDRSVAVLFVDVDDFKAINDSLGHSVGDGVLTHLAERLRDALWPTDTVARLGGDEFAVLVEEMPEAGGGAHVAERILLALAAPTTVGGIELSLGASIGVAAATATAAAGMNAEELMRAADLAMYAAKADGKRRYRTFDPAMLAGAVERLELEAD